MKNVMFAALTAFVVLGLGSRSFAQEDSSVNDLANFVESVSVQQLELDELASKVKKICKNQEGCSRADVRELSDAIENLEADQELQVASSDVSGKAVLLSFKKIFSDTGHAFVLATKYVLVRTSQLLDIVGTGVSTSVKWTIRTGKYVGLKIAGFAKLAYGQSVKAVKFTLTATNKIVIKVGNLVKEVAQATATFSQKAGKSFLVAVEKTTKFTVEASKYVFSAVKIIGNDVKNATLASLRFLAKVGKGISLGAVYAFNKALAALDKVYNYANYRWNRKWLFIAARLDFIVMAERILERRPELAVAKNKRGMTALMLATRYNNESIVKLLVDRVSAGDLGAQDYEGRTALHFVAKTGNLGIAKLLLAKASPASLEKTDRKGRTALDVAIEEDNLDIQEAIVEKLDEDTNVLKLAGNQ